MKKTKKNNRLLLYIAVLLLLLALLGGIFTYLRKQTHWFGGNFGVLDKASFSEANLNTLPQESLFITPDRQNYQTETMRLVIPKLDLDTVVGADTLPATLMKTPGLYEYSQLPSAGDVNVSIAAHRDLANMEFYYLDQLEEGDLIYLIYQDQVYQYEYYSTRIVEADDWSVISRRGFSAVTLTTCDPIGTSRNRMVVVGYLSEQYPYSPSVVFR